MTAVVIASIVRTPIGKFGGTLKGVQPKVLGAHVIAEALRRAALPASEVDEVVMGCVLQAGLGQNIARQCSIAAGLDAAVPSLTVNKVCGSSLKALALAAASIKAEDNRVVVAGGVENMSLSAHVSPAMRWGTRMGDVRLVDSMMRDGLWDAFNEYHMGITAENIAEKYGISRERQDAFALESQQRAAAAQKAGKFSDEIAPVTIEDRKKGNTVFANDEYIRLDASLEEFGKLRAAFKDGGTVTAGNASGINDGAAAAVVMSADRAKELGIRPLAEIVAYASAGVDPSLMGMGAAAAAEKTMKLAGVTSRNIDAFELNEAFAAQALAVVQELGIDGNKVNVNGGAIALGHPIGASGARIAATLIHELRRRGGRYGVASLCIGGGMGCAVVVRSLT